MRRLFLTIAAACTMLGSAPALAQAGDFTLANDTGFGMRDLSIRRFGTRDWRQLGIALSPRGRAPVSFSSPDCVFDISAELSSGMTATWSGINLCEADVVILKREPSGELWVDYD